MGHTESFGDPLPYYIVHDLQGNLKELNKYYKNQLTYHNQLMRKATKDLEQSNEIKKLKLISKINGIVKK